MNLSNSRTRIMNHLDALPRQLLALLRRTACRRWCLELAHSHCGGLICGASASRTLSTGCGSGLRRDLIADIRRLDDQVEANEKQVTVTLDEHGTRLREVDGIGAVTAARMIGRTVRPDRFPTAAAFANYNGSAPVQIAEARPQTSPVQSRGTRHEITCRTPR
jgi:transposase